MKTVHIRSYSGPYSVRMRQNTDQNNSEYGHFLRSSTDEFGDRAFKTETDYLEVTKNLLLLTKYK